MADPAVYLVGGPEVVTDAIVDFLQNHDGLNWQTDTPVAAEKLVEAAGRLCYMSYGKGRKTNREFISHLLEVGHGSVLEHINFSFIITGVSRSFTHELVRHRAGFAFSQLSQRYVDESQAAMIMPKVIADSPLLRQVWLESVAVSRQAYRQLVVGLERVYASEPDPTLRRKLARQAARSVMPNATETKIFVTANARAWRHFIEMRASEAADLEIRRVAVMILRVLREEAPNIFGDYEIVKLPDGSETVRTEYVKV